MGTLIIVFFPPLITKRIMNELPVENCLKTQSTSFAACQSVLDNLLVQVRCLKTTNNNNTSSSTATTSLDMQVDETNNKPIVSDKKKDLENVANVVKSFQSVLKVKGIGNHPYHISVAKLSKAVDKLVSLSDVDDVIYPLLSSEEYEEFCRYDNIYNACIGEEVLTYLIQSGQMEAAHSFAEESGQSNAQSFQDYDKLHAIMEDLDKHNAQSALQWSQSQTVDEGLTLALHEVVCAQILLNEDVAPEQRRVDAVKYTRTHLAPYAHDEHVRKRIGALLTASLWLPTSSQPATAAPTSPYVTLTRTHATAWQRVARRVATAFARSIGQSTPAMPRLVALLECAQPVVPQLLKLARLKRLGAPVDTNAFALPLARQHRYHTVFCCPVTRQAAELDNPPLLLPCGHVLASNTASELASRHGFKCPYCPQQTTLRNCKRIAF